MSATHRRWRHIRISISLSTKTMQILHWQKVIFTDTTNAEFKRHAKAIVEGMQFINQGLPIQGIRDVGLAIYIWETRNPDKSEESPYQQATYLADFTATIG